MCLDNLASIGRRQHQDEISCVICETSIPIPKENTFRDFPTSFHLDRFKDILTVFNGDPASETCMNCNEGKMAISYCFVCQDYLCSNCYKAHRLLRVTRDHRNVLLEKEHLLDLLQRPVMCEQEGHEGEALLYYCDECNECVCQICRDDSHRRHDVVDIEEVAREGKKRLDNILKKAEEEITASEDVIKASEDIFKNKMQEIGEARRDVEAIVNELIKNLKQHEKEVLTNIDRISEEQQNRHAIKKRKLELLVTRLRNAVVHGKCVLERTIGMEIVKEQKAVIGRCKDHLGSCVFCAPLDRYIGRHFDRQSTDISVDISAECRPICRWTYRSSVGRYDDRDASVDVSTDISIDISTEMSAECRSTYRPTISRYIGRHSADMSTINCRWNIGRLSVV